MNKQENRENMKLTSTQVKEIFNILWTEHGFTSDHIQDFSRYHLNNNEIEKLKED